MTGRSLSARGFAAAVLASGALGLAGCGGARSPRLASLPLVPGARVVAQARRCDRGSSPYCALELVLVDPRYGSAPGFVSAERDLLRRRGWSGVTPGLAQELANESPGHKLRVTYATPYVDLKEIALGRMSRARAVELALSTQLFAGSPAMSALLQIGSG